MSHNGCPLCFNFCSSARSNDILCSRCSSNLNLGHTTNGSLRVACAARARVTACEDLQPVSAVHSSAFLQPQEAAKTTLRESCDPMTSKFKCHTKHRIPLLSSAAHALQPPLPLAPFASAFYLIACAHHETTPRGRRGNHTNRFFLSSASRVSRKISLRRCSNDSTSSGSSITAA
jgi:hypothetical protein